MCSTDDSGAAGGAVWADGETYPLAGDRPPLVPALGYGYLYGDGVFETLRVVAGVRPFRLDEHLDRLIASARYLELTGLPEKREIRRIVRETVDAAHLRADGILRLTATRGAAPPGTSLATTRTGKCTLVVTVGPLPDTGSPRRPVTARVVGVRHPASLPPPYIKTTSYQGAILGQRLARRHGADVGIWTDGDGNVTEATTANLFAVVSGTLVTPPPDVCLPGLTRGAVLSLAEGLAFPTSESHLPLDERYGWTEAFLTSSVAGIRPVAAVEGTRLPSAPGPRTAALAEAYSGLFAEAEA